jgi:hypothetical protein
MKVLMTHRMLISSTVLIVVLLSPSNLWRLSVRAEVANNPEQDLLQLEKTWLEAEDRVFCFSLELFLALEWASSAPLGSQTDQHISGQPCIAISECSSPDLMLEMQRLRLDMEPESVQPRVQKAS